ncbi:MAG: SNF2-related protein [Bryobacteraceae bacterium]
MRPVLLRTTPWRHQAEAVEFVRRLYASGKRGAMISAAMGTGKSAMAIYVTLEHAFQRILILCPLRVVQVWKPQFEMHAAVPFLVAPLDDAFTSVRAKREEAERQIKLAHARGLPVTIITNYESSWRSPFAEWALRQKWDLVVADECVPEGTKIATPQGDRPIESIQVGDKVLGFNHRTQSVVTATVQATFRRRTETTLVEVGCTWFTPEHPVWVEDKGYTPAGEVSQQDYVRRINADGRVEVRMVRDLVSTGEAPAVLRPMLFGETAPQDLAGTVVYNLQTASGNYFANGLLVHNCHRLKAPGGKASRYVARLGQVARFKLGLSGTPMPHSPLDVYAYFRFLDPTIFGSSFHRFRQHYAVLGGYQNHQVVGYRNLDELNRKFYSITFPCGKEVLDLPPEVHVTYTCRLGPEALGVYRSLERDLIAEIAAGEITAANALVKLLRLQQITGGYIRTDDGHDIQIDSAKMNLLRDVFEDLDAQEPVVVFCRFHRDLDAVNRVAEEGGRRSLELSGRTDELQRWQAGEAPVLAAQIDSGGLGVDLTRARYAIYYSLGFSLGSYEQSLARVHRPGQRRPVEYIHLVAEGTVDEKVMAALARRADVVNTVLQQLKGQL